MKNNSQAFAAYSRVNDMPDLTNEDGYSVFNEVENIDCSRCSDDVVMMASVFILRTR